MMLLSTSNADGICHVTTVNLDGETNLKTYQSPAETSISFRDVISLSELVGVVECEQVAGESPKLLLSQTHESERPTLLLSQPLGLSFLKD